MKKLKFLAFALFTVFACVSFASCSDDDKDEPEMPSPSVQKRLVKFSINAGSYEITYDSQGRIVAVVYYGYDGQTDRTTTYTYSSSQISATETYSSGDSYMEIYHLNNGLITEQGDITYSYEGGRISKWRDIDGSNKTFEWSNGDISSTSTNWSDGYDCGDAAYKYTDKYDYGRIVGIIEDSDDLLYDDFDPYLVMQGFFGTTPLNLPQDASNTWGNTYAYTYEFDEDGYPISGTRYINGKKIDSLSFFWEKCD